MQLVYNPRTGEFEEKRYQSRPKFSNIHILGERTILIGDAYTVCWNVEDAENLRIDGRDVALTQTSRTFTASTDGTITHKLVASNDCGTVEQSISIRSYAKPAISLTVTKRKLRKDFHEAATLKWDVQNASSVSFVLAGRASAVESHGTKNVSPYRTTTYTILATALNGVTTVEKQITVEVFPIAQIEFHSNREFTLPKVPIVLSWDTRNALSVELVGFGPQALHGELVVKPEAETTYVLRVKDHFETKTKEVTIRLLPVPHIKTLMVPTPQLEQNLQLQIRQPKLNVSLKLPHTHVMGVCFSIPGLKSLTGPGLYVKLEPPLKETSGVFGKIRRLFNHYSLQI